MLAEDQIRVDVLNRLMVVNNSRLEGFREAAETVSAPVLKDLFSRLHESSSQCREELLREVYKLGGRPAQMGEGPGDLPRAWEEFRQALYSGNHKDLLDSCYLEEFMSLKTYEYTLRYKKDHLTRHQHLLFDRQRVVLKQDHEKVSNLRAVLLKS